MRWPRLAILIATVSLLASHSLHVSRELWPEFNARARGCSVLHHRCCPRHPRAVLQNYWCELRPRVWVSHGVQRAREAAGAGCSKACLAAQVHRRSPGRRQDLLTSFVVVVLGQRAPVRVLWGTVGGAASSCRPISREVLGAEIMVTLHRINRFLVIIHLHFMFSHAPPSSALCPRSSRRRRAPALPPFARCAHSVGSFGAGHCESQC